MTSGGIAAMGPVMWLATGPTSWNGQAAPPVAETMIFSASCSDVRSGSSSTAWSGLRIPRCGGREGLLDGAPGRLARISSDSASRARAPSAARASFSRAGSRLARVSTAASGSLKGRLARRGHRLRELGATCSCYRHSMSRPWRAWGVDPAQGDVDPHGQPVLGS